MTACDCKPGWQQHDCFGKTYPHSCQLISVRGSFLKEKKCIKNTITLKLEFFDVKKFYDFCATKVIMYD